MSKQSIVVILSFFLILLASLSGYVKIIYNRIVVQTSPLSLPFLNSTTPTPTPDPLGPFSVLLLGYGGLQHEGGFLTDTIIVAYVQPKKHTVNLISLPRDMWLDLPITATGTVPHKINAAYAIGRDDKRFSQKPDIYKGKGGGGSLAKYAASYVVGFPIDYFIAISFTGFEKSIQVLGGVDVNVPHTFDDFLYPNVDEEKNNCGKTDEEVEAVTATLSGTLLEKEFPCRYEHLHFEQGVWHMDGTTALKFARSRKSETYGGDFNRSLRQLALLNAVKDKVISLNFIPKAFPFIQTLTSDMQTDISSSVISQKLNILSDISSYSVKTISINENNVLEESTSDDGQYILLPKLSESGWKSVRDYINDKITSE
jgi:anionic cell wall polymer biosynthesis LytR-Cps2A-Psr (LCP) family protein